MKVYNLKQGTTEWHELRHGKIGGTTSSQLHTPSDALLNQLIAERLEPFDPTQDGFVSDAMQRGIDMEPQAREYLEEYLSGKLGQPISFIVPGWCESEELPILGFSPDGITEDGTIGIEIKCPSAKVHVEYIRCGNHVPQAHTHQIAQMFTVCDTLRTVYFCSYRPEFTAKPAHIVEVRRESVAPLPKKMGVLTFAGLVQQKLIEAKILNEQIEKELERIEL